MSLNLLTDSQQAQPNYLNHGCAHINKAKKGFLCTKYKYNEQDCFPWDKRLCDSMISRGLCFDWVCQVVFILNFNFTNNFYATIILQQLNSKCNN